MLHLCLADIDKSVEKVTILSWNFPFIELVSESKNIRVMVFMK